MKTYEQMAEDALKRIKKINTEKKKKRKNFAAVTVSAVIVFIIAVFGFSARNELFGTSLHDSDNISAEKTSDYVTSEITSDFSGSATDYELTETEKVTAEATTAFLKNGEPTDVQNSTVTVPVTEKTVEQKDETAGTHKGSNRLWNNLNVRPSLYSALINDPAGVFPVKAEYRPTVSNVTWFIYEGKPLSEWVKNAFVDSPDDTNMMEGYKRAFHAYMDVFIPEVMKSLTEAGLHCERTPYVDNCITVSVNAEQLQNISLEDTELWYFDLADDTDLKN